MPKRKGSPKKLSELQRKEENYCFGGTGPSNNNTPEAAASSSQDEKSPSKKKVKKTVINLRVEKVDGLDELLEDSDFYVSIKQKSPDTGHKEQAQYCLGNLTVKLHDHCIQEEESLPLHDFWLYVSRIPGRSMIYFEWLEEEGTYKRVQVFTVETALDSRLYNVSSKVLYFQVGNYNSSTKELSISVRLHESAILSPEDAYSYEKNVQTSVQYIMKHFYNLAVPDYAMDIPNQHCRDDIESLFSVVKLHHENEAKNTEISNLQVQHANLQVVLRPYQINSVHWMLRREALLHTQPNDELHPLFKEVVTPSGDTLYFNVYLGLFVKDKPTCKASTPGGILADEMGLGKTVEVLSCMLANPRTDLPHDEEEELEEGEKEAAEEEMDISGEGTSRDNVYHGKIMDDMNKDKESSTEELTDDQKDISKNSEINCKEKEVIDEIKQEIPSETDQNKSEAIESPTNECEEETLDRKLHKGSEEQIHEDNKTGDSQRKKSKRIVRFADHGPAIMNYVLDSEEEDTSDASWDGGKAKPKKQSKERKKSKKEPTKKPVKRLKKQAKSILKTRTLDPIEETIEKVINKYRYEYPSAAARAADVAALAKRKECQDRRKALTDSYLSKLAEYSGVKILHDKARKERMSDFFKQKVKQKSLFECICGAEDYKDGLVRVQCSQCSVWQHSQCVRFNIKSKKSYFCPHCWQLQEKIPSKATLIVAPATISPQWMDEIYKLVGKKGMKVEFYSGVHGQGFIQPRSLASNDIVITSYETLCKELDYVDLPHCNAQEGRKFRNAKRYMALPSPLPCIQWWRVCLDEAQMVECTTTRTAEMALRLAAVHRWCITGTPVQKSISDLFGLVLFLGADPYNQLRWWQKLLQNPYRAGIEAPLHEVLCPLMWRTAKVDVLDQICIPEQKEEIHWIHFSPVEEHFYRKQHVQCASVVLNRIAQLPDMDTRLQMLRKDVLTGLVSPLLSLRQACCHPQAVKGQFISLNKTTLTMEELLESLIKKSRVECEESFRQIIAALNGLAGIFVIQEDWRHSVESYREVLMLIEEHKDKIKSDKLQKIHTLHNLAEILESHHDGIPNTLRDSTLREEARDLETKYLNKCIAGMKGAKQTVEPHTQSVIDLQEQLTLPEAWWSLVLHWSVTEREQQEVVERVRQALQGAKRQYRTISYNNVQGLESLLLEVSENLDKLREQLLSEMQKLETTDAQVLVNQAVECHLRTIPSVDGPGPSKSKRRCLLCKTSEIFENYEKILFREEQQRAGHELVENVKVFGKLNRITWAEGEMERLLKALLGYAKLKKTDPDWIQDGTTQIKMMDVKKKEFKYLRTYWRQLNDHISALDELNMCKIRLRLRFPHEPDVVSKKRSPKKKQLTNLSSNLENKVENIYIIEPHEVESHALRFATERSTANGDFRRRLGQLQYLENLQRDGLALQGGSNPELCPICRKALGDKWSVLLCGHCYCMECLSELARHQMRRTINCPVCREFTSRSEISYVNTTLQKPPQQELSDDAAPPDQEAPTILGRNSAKAEAVVLCLKNILAENIDAKALIFSTWQPMLLVLARALRDNSISFAHMETGKKVQESLKLFKDPTKKVTALLLPVHSGSKGLNLIEATHVLLVEPILNPASELQALGRVHRIGQTKKTIIHRFIVRGTIEERMHIVLRGHKNALKLDEDPVCLRDLYNMFATTDADNNSTEEEEELIDQANIAGPSSSHSDPNGCSS